MIIKHTMRHDFTERERRIIGAGLVAHFGPSVRTDERALATRQEIKNLLDDFGKCSDMNPHWNDLFAEGEEQLQKWNSNAYQPNEVRGFIKRTPDSSSPV